MINAQFPPKTRFLFKPCRYKVLLAGAGVAGHLGTRTLMMLKDKYGFKDYER